MKRLDVVRTPGGNIGVVKDKGTMGSVSLAFRSTRVQEKTAWWDPDELTRLFNVGEMVEVLDTETIKELIRLRKGERQ